MNTDIRIAVLQRGWVLVGHYSREEDRCKLTDASVIRRWGTRKGLGELVQGPLNGTVLDKCGTVEFEAITGIMTIQCEADKWEHSL